MRAFPCFNSTNLLLSNTICFPINFFSKSQKHLSSYDNYLCHDEGDTAGRLNH